MFWILYFRSAAVDVVLPLAIKAEMEKLWTTNIQALAVASNTVVNTFKSFSSWNSETILYFLLLFSTFTFRRHQGRLSQEILREFFIMFPSKLPMVIPPLQMKKDPAVIVKGPEFENGISN